jgi:hypothetical protein
MYELRLVLAKSIPFAAPYRKFFSLTFEVFDLKYLTFKFENKSTNQDVFSLAGALHWGQFFLERNHCAVQWVWNT